MNNNVNMSSNKMKNTTVAVCFSATGVSRVLQFLLLTLVIAE